MKVENGVLLGEPELEERRTPLRMIAVPSSYQPSAISFQPENHDLEPDGRSNPDRSPCPADS